MPAEHLSRGWSPLCNEQLYDAQHLCSSRTGQWPRASSSNFPVWSSSLSSLGRGPQTLWAQPRGTIGLAPRPWQVSLTAMHTGAGQIHLSCSSVYPYRLEQDLATVGAHNLYGQRHLLWRIILSTIHTCRYQADPLRLKHHLSRSSLTTYNGFLFHTFCYYSYHFIEIICSHSDLPHSSLCP